MADEDQAPEEGEAGGAGGGKLLLIIALVNTLGLLGLAAYVVLGGGTAPAASPEAMAEQAMERPDGERARDEAGPTMELGTLVVNLGDATGDRFLKTKLQLELDSEETRAEVEQRISQIRYQLTLLISGQRVTDVKGPENIEALRKAMTRRANTALSKGRVVDIWPDEWIVQ